MPGAHWRNYLRSFPIIYMLNTMKGKHTYQEVMIIDANTEAQETCW